MSHATNLTEPPEPNSKFDVIKKLIDECYSGKTNHSKIKADNFTKTDKLCPRFFDGLACWDPTPAGATAMQKCPYFLIGFDSSRYVYKRCTEDGKWDTRQGHNIPWTNFTSCIDIEDLEFRELINKIYVVTYTISIISLILSLVIFKLFSITTRRSGYAEQRSVQCTRVQVHMHLFSAFLISDGLWLVWLYFVAKDVIILQNNPIWCQGLHLAIHYFMVSSYLWMFCESLHLFLSLVIKLQVFVKEDTAMTWFKWIAWGGSFVIVTVYAIVRYQLDDIDRCWLDYGNSFWIIVTPILGTMLTSLGFLIHIIKILVLKLRPPCNQDNSTAPKKAVRAALLLIPLFGLHFMLIPLRPTPNTQAERVYDVTSAILAGSQGLCVTLLFCFTNRDILSVIRNQWNRFIRRTEIIPLTDAF